MNWITHWLRNRTGVNEDMQHIAGDIQTLAKSVEKLHQDLFTMFHALPFTAGVLTLTAADAAKFIAPSIEQNGLISLLTSIVLATRQGQSSLQVVGEMDPKVRIQLEKRGFKVEEIQGSDDNKGLFILWT
jgi:hypothetical protein